MILQSACKLLYFFIAMNMLVMFYSVYLFIHISKTIKNETQKKLQKKRPKATQNLGNNSQGWN